MDVQTSVVRPASSTASIWATVREAVRGTPQDYSEGAIGRAVVLLARSDGPRNDDVIPYGVRCLRIVAAGFLFYGYGMVLTQSFNGAGDTWTATFIHLGCLWFLEIPLAWVLAYPFGWGPTGVLVAVSVAFSALALVSATIFRLGRWKTKQVEGFAARPGPGEGYAPLFVQ
jgi:hypothetical protein